MDGYIYEIKSTTTEIKRLNKELKALRTQKTKTEINLVNYMKRSNINEYNGYKLHKLDPGLKPLRQKMSQKRDKTIDLFRTEGISDPNSLWLKIKELSKPTKK